MWLNPGRWFRQSDPWISSRNPHERHRFRLKDTGNYWNMKAVFPPGNLRIFLVISDSVQPFPRGKNVESLEKSVDFQARKLLLCSGDFRYYSAGSSRYFLTWELMARCRSWDVHREGCNGDKPSPIYRHRFTVTGFTDLHRSPSPVSPVFTDHRHRFHRSLPVAINTEHLTIRGEKLPLRYQLHGNGVTEVSAIRFLTKDFQYSFFEGFGGRRIWNFSVSRNRWLDFLGRKGLFYENNEFS